MNFWFYNLNLPVNVVGCPIFREDNQLAMSSRNERLSPEERKEAAIIYKVLTQAKEIFQTESPEETIKFVENSFKDNKGFELEYFVIADESTLLPNRINKYCYKCTVVFVFTFMIDR